MPVMRSSEPRIHARRPSARHVHHRLQLHAIVQLAVLDARRAGQLHRLADARLAHVDALLVDLHRRVGGEQIGGVVPQLLVHVEAVGVLQPHQLAFVVQSRHPALEIGHARLRVTRRRRRGREARRARRRGSGVPARSGV